MLNSKTRLLIGIGSIAVTLALGGCTHPDITRRHLFRPDARIPVELAGPELRADAPLAFDIRNERGSVWIEIDEKLDAPVVEGIVSWKYKDRTDAWPSDGASVVIDGTRSTQGPGDVVSINTAMGVDAPESVFLDLRVRTPRCDGVNVVNDGGPIVLVGVGGAITAHNGAATGAGGRIELRTSEAIIDPVALVTTRGRVSAVIGPGGRGLIELESESGSAEFGTAYGTLSDVRPSMSRYRGVWNDGANPIVAKSADGDVHIIVKPNAEMYSIADDWMALLGD